MSYQYRTERVWWGKEAWSQQGPMSLNWILNVTPNARLKCGQQKFIIPSPSPPPRKARTKQSKSGRLMSRRSLLMVFSFCFCVILFFLFLVFLGLNYALPHRSGSFALRIMTNSFRFFSRYGDGYTVTLRIGGEEPNLDAVSEFISSLFPGAVLKVRNSADLLSYTV